MSELGKTISNNQTKKFLKKLKINVKLPHANEKPLARKRIFVQTPLSHSTLKLERQNFTPQSHSLFVPLPVSA